MRVDQEQRDEEGKRRPRGAGGGSLTDVAVGDFESPGGGEVDDAQVRLGQANERSGRG
jgi:hypothetical protein